MNAYVYEASLLCEPCGKAQRRDLDQAFADNGCAPGSNLDDSDRYPQGPYPDGGGEADTPQHCDRCGVFLENPLTGDGEEYVREAVDEWRNSGYGFAARQWSRFYSYLFEET